ncbi:MAG: VWA domain-containing protein [Lachnospiraceae bacterium]|nr:VWA domain-containing protein [Prevotella sp.]MCM1074675.1 VWA domain-containing protein [Ruminococcus sp.]MCM1224037.1 VWA domain-containing protein [Lachnospiraceae bacterium]
MTFAYPILLLLLLFVPVLWLLYIAARKARCSKLDKFGKQQNLKELMPDVSPYKPGIRIALRLTAVAALVIALARPWGGLVEQEVNREGIEVVAVVDVSNSMLASASDDPQGTKRIDAAKLLLDQMVEGMANDRIGLVTFAGDAYSLIPVSSDYASVKSFMGVIDPGQIFNQGTNIAAAIDRAMETFTPDSPSGKAIVIFTDVEELEDEQEVLNAVKNARKHGVQIDVVGVGTVKGNVINTPEGLFTDDKGNVVNTKLNEELGKHLAKEGGGVYVNASSANALATLQKQLKQVKRTALSANHTVLHDELFVYFAAFALILLLADAFMVNRKNNLLRKVTFFSKEK